VIPAPSRGAMESGGSREVIPAPSRGAMESGGNREAIPAPSRGAMREVARWVIPSLALGAIGPMAVPLRYRVRCEVSWNTETANLAQAGTLAACEM